SDRVELRIDVDAMEIEPERGVQLLCRALPVREPVKHVLRRCPLVEGAEKILYEVRSRAPHVLGTPLHDASAALRRAQPLQLAVQCEDRRTQAHMVNSPSQIDDMEAPPNGLSWRQ